MNVEPVIYHICDRMPCHGISMGPEHLTAGHKHRATTGNGDGSVRLYLNKMHVREACWVLGWGVRAQLPERMERFVKSSFPNEDRADCAGFAKADACEQAQAATIVVLTLCCPTKVIIDRLILHRNSQLESHKTFTKQKIENYKPSLGTSSNKTVFIYFFECFGNCHHHRNPSLPHCVFFVEFGQQMSAAMLDETIDASGKHALIATSSSDLS